MGVKILKFFDEDPGSGMEIVRIRDPGWKKVGSGIRDKHPGSATLVLFQFRSRAPSYFLFFLLVRSQSYLEIELRFFIAQLHTFLQSSYRRYAKSNLGALKILFL